MSKSRFIKLIDSEKTEWLVVNFPNAFLLLTIIARRARRQNGHIDGLQIGDALIGDHLCAGLTRQQYRTALQKLIELGLVEIVYNGKKFLKREKSTIKITIKGMLVNLKDSSVYDINSEDSNHHSNQRATNEQPTSNHEQERIRKNKNVKEERKLTKEREPLVASLLADFYSSLLLAIPNFNKEKSHFSDAQYSAMKKLLDLHGEPKVREVFCFAHTSEFWKAHVHTPIYLKIKFETLSVQLENHKKGNKNENFNQRIKQRSDILPIGGLRARRTIKAVPDDS